MTTPNQSPAPRSASLADGGDASPWARTPARGPEPILEVGVEKTSGGTGGATSGGSAEVVSTPERKKKTANLGEGPLRNDGLKNQDHVADGQLGDGATATRTPDDTILPQVGAVLQEVPEPHPTRIAKKQPENVGGGPVHLQIPWSQQRTTEKVARWGKLPEEQKEDPAGIPPWL